MVSDLTGDGFSTEEKESLNPYSTGRWFLILQKIGLNKYKNGSLNPYSTGRWFLIISIKIYKLLKLVLILILLEDGF